MRQRMNRRRLRFARDDQAAAAMRAQIISKALHPFLSRESGLSPIPAPRR